MDAGGVTCVWRGCWTPTCQWSPTYPTWHIDTPITTISLTRQQVLPVLPEGQQKNFRGVQKGSFPGGLLPTAATFDKESGLGIIGNPPSHQKSPRPGRSQKACTSFPARCFLIQADNNGCQCALNEAQSCLSNPEKKLWNK